MSESESRFDGVLPITFVRLDDETIWVEPWPAHILVTTELMRAADPQYFRVGEGVMEFNASNGHAIYTVGEMTPEMWEGRLFESSWAPMPSEVAS